MHIDQDTLADIAGLGSLRAPNGDDLLTFFDRTESAGGRRKLSEFFMQPLSSVASISARQQTLRALNSLSPRPVLIGADRFIAVAKNYLASSYQRFPATRLDCWIFQHRYPEAVAFVAEGLLATRGFLEIAGQVLAALQPLAGKSDELSAIAAVLRRCLQADSCAELCKVNPGDTSHLALVVRDAAIRDNRAQIVDAIAAIHLLDALLSLATVSGDPSFSFPEVVDAERSFLQVTRLFHPLLGRDHTYDVSLPADSPVFFLTGPNMAGKSTLLRACGLLVLMAHVGMAVPATQATLSIYDRLFSSLNSRDSLSRGESHYSAEVKRIVQVLDHVASGDRVFALLDEMFKSTNIKDAYDGTELVVAGLSKSHVGSFMIASHLAELGLNFRDEAGVRMYRIEAIIKDGGIQFPRVVEPGVSEQRLGMLLLEREGALALLHRIGDTPWRGRD